MAACFPIHGSVMGFLLAMTEKITEKVSEHRPSWRSPKIGPFPHPFSWTPHLDRGLPHVYLLIYGTVKYGIV